jgi:sarcosine oxidase subunit alpha
VTRRIACDLVCVSGGFNPAGAPFSQARGKLRYDDALAAFVPDVSPMPISPPVARTVAAISRPRWPTVTPRAWRRASERVARDRLSAPHAEATQAGATRALWACRAEQEREAFVDLQNDVTANDIALAAREGYTSIEHLKRYTTLGMGTDQGKTSNITGLALLAERLQRTIPEVGTTTFRPPYTPVTLGAIPGHEAAAPRAGARDADARLARGAWRALRQRRIVAAAALVSAPGEVRIRRSQPRSEERPRERRRRRRVDARQDRVAGARRRRVPESRLHQSLGHARRRPLPLRRDAARRRHGAGRRHDVALAPTHYLMTTTTINAARIMQHLEFLLQACGPSSTSR